MRSTRLAVSIAGLAVAGAGLTVPVAEAAPAPVAPYNVTLLASTKVSGKTTRLLLISVFGAAMTMLPATLPEAVITLSGVRMS